MHRPCFKTHLMPNAMNMPLYMLSFDARHSQDPDIQVWLICYRGYSSLVWC